MVKYSENILKRDKACMASVAIVVVSLATAPPDAEVEKTFDAVRLK